MLFGICGGLGEYFDISSTLIRIIWVIAVLCFGTGFLVYFICLLLMPFVLTALFHILKKSKSPIESYR